MDIRSGFCLSKSTRQQRISVFGGGGVVVLEEKIPGGGRDGGYRLEFMSKDSWVGVWLLSGFAESFG